MQVREVGMAPSVISLLFASGCSLPVFVRFRPLHGPGRKICETKQAGPNVRRAGLAINFRLAYARFIETARTHSSLVCSFQCINMKLLLTRVIRCRFHIDDVRSLLPVICYRFIHPQDRAGLGRARHERRWA